MNEWLPYATDTSHRATKLTLCYVRGPLGNGNSKKNKTGVPEIWVKQERFQESFRYFSECYF